MFDSFLNAETNIFLLIGALLVGLIIIIWGGDKFVDSSIWIAVKTKMPKMLIGATLVSIGTTLPEMFASYTAASGGSTDLAIGNSLGSIMCNTAMVLSITLIFASGVVNRKQFLPKFIILMSSVVLTLAFALTEFISLWQCILLFAIGIGYLVYNVVGAIIDSKKSVGNVELNEQLDNSEQDDDEYEQYKDKKSWVMILLFVLGAAGIAVGANLMVSSVSGLCTQIGMSQSVIALTVVAIGTSLPELVTTLTSLKKSSADLSLGNVLGANVLNATLIVGGSGLFTSGLTLGSSSFVTTIVTVSVIIVVLLVLAIPVLAKQRTYRWQGITCLSIYLAYTAYLVSQVMVV